MSVISLQRPSLAQEAYAVLEEMLVTLKLPPGAPVQEKELAAVAGIGRTPVREAVQKLASEGLLQVIPRKGLIVTPVLRSDLAQIVEARRVLERLMVVKAGERATPDQRQALDALAGHLEQVSGDLEGFFRLDHRLDELLEAACSNRHLVRALAPMHSHCRRLWYLNREQLDLESAARMHAGLARAVSCGDGAGAVRALNGIIAVLEQLVSGLDSIS